jgi:Mn2+/Fe2+ NRAMP family transporter
MSNLTVSPPPVPRRRRFVRPAALLLVLGPGVIAASAGNDAGGIATYASAGKQFTYQTLFIAVLIIAALVAVQEMAARLGAYSGEGLMSLVREEFSLRIGAFAVVCLLIANLGLVVSEFAGIGAAFEIFGVSRYLSVPMAAMVILGVVLYGSYRRAERVFLMFSLVFLVYPVAMILAGPDWGQVAKDTIIPHFDMSRDFLSSRSPSSVRRSRRTCSCTRRPRSPTAESDPTSTSTSGSTRSSARCSPVSSSCVS